MVVRENSRTNSNAITCFQIAIGCALTIAFSFLSLKAISTWRADAELRLLQNQEITQPAALDALKLATIARPDLSWPWQEQAQELSFDHPHRAELFARHAVRLNSHNWNNWRTLGMIQFQLGNIPAAQHDLVLAARYERGYLAHYQLANFSWILGDKATFWRQMKKALAIAPPADAANAINTILRLAGLQPGKLMPILPPRPEIQLEAAGSLANAGHLNIAYKLWRKNTCPSWYRAQCHSLTKFMISVYLRAVQSRPAAKSVAPIAGMARKIWNTAIAQHVLNAAPVRVGEISDGSFQYPRRGWFAWSRNTQPIVQRFQSSTFPGYLLDSQFSEEESGSAWLASQWVPVIPGNKYRVEYQDKGVALRANHGLSLIVRTLKGDILAKVTAKLGSGWSVESGDFQVPLNTPIVLIGFNYQRPLGELPLSGEVRLARVQMKAVSLPVAAAAKHSAKQKQGPA